MASFPRVEGCTLTRVQTVEQVVGFFKLKDNVFTCYISKEFVGLGVETARSIPGGKDILYDAKL